MQRGHGQYKEDIAVAASFEDVVGTEGGGDGSR